MLRHPLQWGHGISAVEVNVVVLRIEIDRIASMGPRHFSRGSLADDLALALRGSSFNGATAFQPWKSRSRTRIGSSFRLLQWGHGISAVEVCEHAEEGA